MEWESGHFFQQTRIPSDGSTLSFSNVYYQPFQIIETWRLHLNILLTCKQLHVEGQAVLVRENQYVAINCTRYHVTEVLSALKTFGRVKSWLAPLKKTQNSTGLDVGTYLLQGGLIRPALTITIHPLAGEFRPQQESNLLLLHLDNLKLLCQALSILKAAALRGIRLIPAHDYQHGPPADEAALKLKLSINMTSILSRVSKDNDALKEYFVSNLFEWVGTSIEDVDSSTCNEGFTFSSGLTSWVREQYKWPDKRKDTEKGEQMIGLVLQKFREAESLLSDGMEDNTLRVFCDVNHLVSTTITD